MMEIQFMVHMDIQEKTGGVVTQMKSGYSLDLKAGRPSIFPRRILCRGLHP